MASINPTARDADAQTFKDEFGPHPLGTLAETRAVGPFVAEHYSDVLGNSRREREGEAPNGRITVWVKTPGGDRYAEPVAALMDDRETVAERYEYLTVPEAILAFVDEFADDGGTLDDAARERSLRAARERYADAAEETGRDHLPHTGIVTGDDDGAE